MRLTAGETRSRERDFALFSKQMHLFDWPDAESLFFKTKHHQILSILPVRPRPPTFDALCGRVVSAAVAWFQP